MIDDESFKIEFEKLCKDQNLKNPIELLMGMANGVNLSEKSLVAEKAAELTKIYGEELPDIYDYLELIELIKNTYQHEFVNNDTQLKAQKTLIEYQHAKKKSVDVNLKTEAGAVSKLTVREIEMFWKKFNAEY